MLRPGLNSSGRPAWVWSSDAGGMLQVLETLRRAIVGFLDPRRRLLQTFGRATSEVSDGLGDPLTGRGYATFDKAFGDLADRAVAHPASSLRAQRPTVVLDLAGVSMQLVGRMAESIRVDLESTPGAAHEMPPPSADSNTLPLPLTDRLMLSPEERVESS